MSKVNIDEDFDDVASTKVAVPYVEADGKLYYPNAKGVITVPEHPSKLTVYPYVFTYSLINPDVTYYLRGVDKSRSTVKRKDLVPIDYTNLRGGTYSFVIDLSDSMGHDTAEYRTRVIISKAFYEKTWFYAIAAAAAAFIIAQIIAVADTFDAMYSDRPYRRRMNFDKVMEIMKEVSGTQLEADVVEALLRLAEKGQLRAKDDRGGGSTEDINNIHRRQEEEEKKSRPGKAKDEEVTE